MVEYSPLTSMAPWATNHIPSNSKAVWSQPEGKFLLASCLKLGSWYFAGIGNHLPWGLLLDYDQRVVSWQECQPDPKGYCIPFTKQNYKLIHYSLGDTSVASSTLVSFLLFALRFLSSASGSSTGLLCTTLTVT